MPSCKSVWGIWLFHAYPLLYLWASLQKTGSALSLYYCGLVFVLVHVSTTPVLLDGGTLRLLCGLLAALSTALLIASLLMHLGRYWEWAGAVDLDFLGLLGPQGHAGFVWVLTDCTIAVASIASWTAVNTDPEAHATGASRSSTNGHGLVVSSLGVTPGVSGFMQGAASLVTDLRLSVSSRSSVHGAAAPAPEILARTRRSTLKGVALQSTPLTRSSRMWQVCTWLLLCALLDCNLFAAVYMVAAVAAALALALWPASREQLPTGLIDRARKGLLLIMAINIIVAALCTSFLHKYGDVPRWAYVLLGKPASFWRNMQCFCVLPLAVELLRSKVEDIERRSTQTIGLETPAAMFELAGMSASAPSDHREDNEERIAQFELEGASSSAPTAAVERLEDEDQESAAPQAQAASGRRASQTPPLRWRDNLLRCCITAVSLVNDEDRPEVCMRCLGSLLSLLSLITWPLIWPGIQSVPLLIGGLIALERPLHDLHPWTLRSLVAYEGLLCIWLLVTRIWYDTRGEIGRWERDVGFSDFSGSVLAAGWPHIRRSLLVACLAILLQLLALSAFCMGEAAIPPADLNLSHRSNEWRRTRSRTLFFIRMIIVTTVVMLALGIGPSGESSLAQLGYLLWFLFLLYRSDELPISLVGWDVLRGNVYSWRALQNYSACVSVALLCWRSLHVVDLPLVGFLHDPNDLRQLHSLWMHLSLAVLAASQTSTLRAPSLHHSSIFVQLTNPVRWLLNFGILLQFGLLLIAALLPPHSFDAFVLLVLACVIILVGQFSMQRKYFLPLLNLAAAISMVVLIFRSTIQLTVAQVFLKMVLPPKRHRVLWKVLAMKPCTKWCVNMCWRHRLIALLVMLSRVLAKSIKLAMMHLDENMYIEPLPPRSALALRVAQRWSPLWLIAAFYISVISHPLDFLSSFQLVTLELVLILGKGWEYAGAFLSGCSCTLLIAQYLCRYDFVYLAPEQKEYWGLEWTFESITREVILLVCAIVQRTIHYHAVAAQTAETNDPGRLRRSSFLLPAKMSTVALGQDEGPDWLVALSSQVLVPFCTVLGSYGAHIGIVILVLVSIIRSSVWSVAFAATVAAFLLSGDASRCLKPKQTKAWLKTMAVMVMFAPLSAGLLDLWLPPGTIPKPSAASLGDSMVCYHFEQNILRRHDGTLCYSRDTPDCMPQSQRCGQDWCDWLLMGRGGRYEFVAFFLLCMINRADRLLLGVKLHDTPDDQVDAEVQDRPEPGELDVDESSPDTVPSISVQDSNTRTAIFSQTGTSARDVEEGSSHEVQVRHTQTRRTNVTLSVPETKSVARSIFEPRSVARSIFQSRFSIFSGRTSLRSDVANSYDSFEHSMPAEEANGWRCIYATTAALWIAMFAAFASQPTMDGIAMGYLFLLIDHMGTLGNATLARDPLQAFLSPTIKVNIFNFIVIVSSMAFQCPSMPCPYTIKLPIFDQAEFVSSFMSNRQCRDHSDERMEEAGCLLGAIFRCIGLMKSEDPLYDNASRIWTLVIFILCLLQIIFTSRWRMQLLMFLEAERRRLKGRATWYIAKLLSQRHLQLSGADTKRQVLLGKLNRLTQHLDTLRSIWDGQRVAFTDAEEAHREWENRIESVCLQSGQDRKLVEKLLKEFDVAAEGMTSSALTSQTISRQVNTDKIDEYLIKYLHYSKMRALRKITLEEEEARKADLLLLCRALTWDTKWAFAQRRSSVASLMGSRWSINGPQPGVVGLIAARRLSGESLPPDEDEDAEYDVGDCSVPASVLLEAGIEPPAEGYLYTCIQGMLYACIDDTVFFREGDQTLRQHRKDDGLLTLLLKAIISHTLVMLVVATFLQFSCYRSVTAAIPVFCVTLSLMAFPHVPWQFWVILQWYNLSVIFAKLLIQLPVFCADGTIRVAKSGGFGGALTGCPPCSKHSIPWTAIFGLLKVQGVHRKDQNEWQCMFAPSYTTLLWADLLVTMVLLLSMLVSRWSGRFESLTKILELFREQDNAIAEGLGKGEEVKDWLSYLQEHSMDNSFSATSTSPSTVYTEATSSASLSSVKDFFQNIFDEMARVVVGSSWTRRPSLDLYPYRFFFRMVILAIIMLGWSAMMGTGRTFAESVASNSFSGSQAIVLVIFMVGIILDRALYTWYTHDPCEYDIEDPDGADESCSSVEDRDLRRNVRLSTAGSQMTDAKEQHKQWKRQHRIFVTTIQKGLVIVELLTVHIAFIMHWSIGCVPAAVQVSLLCMDNVVTCVFYTCITIYLALTSLQLRYDVHVMKGGLRATHSNDLFTVNMFRIYSVLPFLHEMRVLTDWTVTTTSLNFFMWMKLEDAHHNLFRTRCDFLFRAQTADAEKRPLCEKIITGGMLLLVLLVLLVGPVCFFSTLNWFWAVQNPVHSAKLSVSLEVQPQAGEDVRAMELYTAGQFHIKKLGRLDAMSLLLEINRPEAQLMLQEIVFPESSDNFWMISKASRNQMSSLLTTPGVRAYVVVSMDFERMGVKAFGKDRVELESEAIHDLADVLSTSEATSNSRTFRIPNLFSPLKLLNARSDVTNIILARGLTAPLDMHMKLHADTGSGAGLPSWSLARADNQTWTCNGKWQDTPETPGSSPSSSRTCRVSYTVASEYVSKMGGEQKGGGGGITVMGLYIGVIYSIGQSLRNVFKGVSKNIIYEEMPDTDLLFDLCNGIYIARIQGNLDAEYKLYHELIRIYRSPELLSHIATPKRRKQPESLIGARSSVFSGSPTQRMGVDAANSPAAQALNRRTSRQ